MVGSHVIDYLIEKGGYKILLFLRWQENMQNLEHLFEQSYIKSHRNYIWRFKGQSSISVCFHDHKIDHVYLGAQSYPKTSFENPIETYTSNIIGTENLMSCVREYSPTTRSELFTSEVFGRVDKDKLPISEECTFHPASPYAVSKVGTDLIGRFLWRGL